VLFIKQRTSDRVPPDENRHADIIEMRQRCHTLEESIDTRPCRWVETAAVQDATSQIKAQVSEIVRIAELAPAEFGLPYGTWSLAKLQNHLTRPHGLLKAIGRGHLPPTILYSTPPALSRRNPALTPTQIRLWEYLPSFPDIVKIAKVLTPPNNHGIKLA